MINNRKIQYLIKRREVLLKRKSGRSKILYNLILREVQPNHWSFAYRGMNNFKKELRFLKIALQVIASSKLMMISEFRR